MTGSPEPVAAPAPPLGQVAARAGALFASTDVVGRFLFLGLSVLTARELGPRELGILGIAVMVVALVSVAAGYPGAAAVAAPAHWSPHQCGVVASFGHALIAILAGGLVAAAIPPIAVTLMGSREDAATVVHLTHALLAVLAAELATTYPVVVLQRRLQLQTLAVGTLTQQVTHVSVAAVLLLLEWRAPALVVAQIASVSTLAAFYWRTLVTAGLRPVRELPPVRLVRDMARTTGRLATGGLPGFVSERIDNILVAAALGPTALGFYSLAWNTSRVPVTLFLRLGNSVLLPTFSRISGEPRRLAEAATVTGEHMMALAAPCAALLSVLAPSIVEIALGPTWRPAGVCLQVLAVAVLAAPFLSVSHAVLVATGRAHLLLVASGAQMAVQLLLIPPAARLGGITGAVLVDPVAVLALTGTLTYLALGRDAGLWAPGPLGRLMAPAFAGWLAGSIPLFFMEPGLRCALLQTLLFTTAWAGVAHVVSGFRYFEMLAALGRRAPVATESAPAARMVDVSTVADGHAQEGTSTLTELTSAPAGVDPMLWQEFVTAISGFLGKTGDEVAAQLRLEAAHPGKLVADAWQAAAPTTPEQVSRYYQETDSYIYGLAYDHCRPQREPVWSAILARINRRGTGQRVLCYGDGIGTDSLALARAGHAVTYFDLPGITSRFAQYRFQQSGLQDRISIVDRADAIPAGSFDAAVCVEVLEHIPQPVSVMEALYSYLRPGGVALITESFGAVGPEFPSHLPENFQYAGRTHQLMEGIGFASTYFNLNPVNYPMEFTRPASRWSAPLVRVRGRVRRAVLSRAPWLAG